MQNCYRLAQVIHWDVLMSSLCSKYAIVLLP
jgi:hypothetical protein